MDGRRIDDLSRSVAVVWTRRRSLQRGAAAIAALMAGDVRETEAGKRARKRRKRRRRKQERLCKKVCGGSCKSCRRQCADACLPLCPVCTFRTDEPPDCAGNPATNCVQCTSDDDCPVTHRLCVTGSLQRETGKVNRVAECGDYPVGVCVVYTFACPL